MSLSTAESELHGIANGNQVALGMKSMFSDLNIDIPLRIHSDATAAIGIARRRGLGKLRHLDVEDLWVQEKVRNKQVEIVKVLGTDNPSDLMTKHVDAKLLGEHVRSMGCEFVSGRA